MKYIRQILDLTFIFPNKVLSTSYFIAFLQSLLFRELPLDTSSHTQTAEDIEHDLSAGALGTKSIIPDPNLRFETYRFHKVTPEMIENFFIVAKKLKGKGYDFFVYIQWLLSLWAVFIVLESAFTWKWSVNPWILLIIYLPGMIGLRIASKYTWHCSESTSYIDSVTWKYFNFKKHSFVSPYLLYKMIKCNPKKWKLVNKSK